MSRRTITALLSIGMVLVATGCAGAGGATSPSPSAPALAALAQEELGTLDGVEKVTLHDPSIASTPEPQDPDAPSSAPPTPPGTISLAVEMVAAVTVDQAVAVAERTHEFSEEHAGGSPWRAHVYVGGGELTADDLVANPTVQVEVFPSEAAPGESIRAAFEATSIDGVSSVAIGAGWPEVGLADAAAFAGAHSRLRAIAPFTLGARYTTPDGRLIVVDVPERVSAEALAAIASIAAQHPQADVALEAGYDGPRWPQLYVNRVTHAEAEAIMASLSAPSLADADPEGYPLEFFIRAYDDAGSIDLGGTFGGVPPQ